MLNKLWVWWIDKNQSYFGEKDKIITLRKKIATNKMCDLSHKFFWEYSNLIKMFKEGQMIDFKLNYYYCYMKYKSKNNEWDITSLTSLYELSLILLTSCCVVYF